MDINLIVTIGIVLFLAAGFICYFLNQKKTVKQWLFYAVTEAEKALGSKLGQLKLGQVFENFIKIFPFFSKLITPAIFSKWVDLAIVEMKEYLTSNKKASEYVGTEKEEKKD